MSAYSLQPYCKLYSGFTSLSTFANFLFWDLIQDVLLNLKHCNILNIVFYTMLEDILIR